MKTPNAYNCECGWSRTILDGETWDQARVIHTSLPIHREAMAEKAARKARGYVSIKAPSWGPSREGSTRCESGSIASGGTREFCSCDTCF